MYIYDLSRAPASFDFLMWLAVCATHAQGPFDVTILKGPKEGFRDDDLEPQDVNARLALLHNVVIPATHLFNVRSLTLFPDSCEDGENPRYIYPELYQGRPVPGIKPPEWAMQYVQQYGNPVVMSLRGSKYHQCRNSNVDNWLDAAAIIEQEGRKVIIVPEFGDDTKYPFEVVKPDNLLIRAALHEQAYINLSINAGVCGLFYLNPRATYGMLIEESNTHATTRKWFDNLGWYRDKDLPFSYDNQKLYWCDDSTENILKAYHNTPKEKQDTDHFPAGQVPVSFIPGLNTEASVMLENIKTNLARGLPEITEAKAHRRKALIVGGGESLNDFRSFSSLLLKKNRGGDVFAMNGSMQWLMGKGVVPKYYTMLDARPENAEFVRSPVEGVEYLIAAQCHPSVFDRLEGFNVTTWVGWLDDVGTALTKDSVVVAGGGTVGLRTIALAYLMGYREIHLYGFDSCHGEKSHAYDQPLNNQQALITITCLGKEFVCSRSMAKQAQDFQPLYNTLTNKGCSIVVHGTGLIPHIMEASQTTVDETAIS